jgi:hypothetical protein
LSQAGKGEIAAQNVVVVDSTTITCTFNLPQGKTGSWDVIVMNPGLIASAPKAGAFEIT